MQKIEPIITEIGKIWGRDAIYLDEMKMINEMTFQLSGEITNPVEKKYIITFKEVYLFKMIELDFDELEYQSSFDIVKNSEQVNNMIKLDKEEHIGKIDNSFMHFVFRTYDTVFEIIGKEYELELK